MTKKNALHAGTDMDDHSQSRRIATPEPKTQTETLCGGDGAELLETLGQKLWRLLHL